MAKSVSSANFPIAVMHKGFRDAGERPFRPNNRLSTSPARHPYPSLKTGKYFRSALTMYFVKRSGLGPLGSNRPDAGQTHHRRHPLPIPQFLIQDRLGKRIGLEPISGET